MTFDEWKIIAKGIIAYYPTHNVFPTPESGKLWFEQLKDIPYIEVQKVINEYVKFNKYPPSIADIRQGVTDMLLPKVVEWSDAWEEVLNIAFKYGSYRGQEAIAELKKNEIAYETLSEIGGYRNLCASENLSVERANFRDVYNRKISKEKVDRLKLDVSNYAMVGKDE